MEDTKEKKRLLREEIITKYADFSEDEIEQKTRAIEEKLFDFANFLESKITLIYLNRKCEINPLNIIRICLNNNKMMIIPVFNSSHTPSKLLKIENIETDLIENAGVLAPNPKKCKPVPMECLDIAIIPGVAFDEKGGRLGLGEGYYDRLIPELPVTTRKVALAFEDQIVSQLPMESHDKHVDIIITDKRVIYKI